ncbi:predicted protein [Histoplasma capsulatum G186AR]|uniref:Uncharacterized protein n=1 Tax=Ajellomyces capsulatus (strain G186AR / H82 / ATCC MYA-2454 / RMSCC 2432) TaxID=447093 RepID=C0NND8_AJECG|nr:uncharacterized protein HCBG_04265 [Histoplasma capsulatum G186AR]EEH07386.1 predicted protein [Histoplasma capsulatum G186AR]
MFERKTGSIKPIKRCFGVRRPSRVGMKVCWLGANNDKDSAESSGHALLAEQKNASGRNEPHPKINGVEVQIMGVRHEYNPFPPLSKLIENFLWASIFWTSAATLPEDATVNYSLFTLALNPHQDEGTPARHSEIILFLSSSPQFSANAETEACVPRADIGQLDVDSCDPEKTTLIQHVKLLAQLDPSERFAPFLHGFGLVVITSLKTREQPVVRRENESETTPPHHLELQCWTPL